MADDEDTQPSSEDRVIDSQRFQLGGGIDLGAFMTNDDIDSAKRPALPGGSPTDATASSDSYSSSENREEEVPDTDEAIGEIFEIFDTDNGPKPGDILADGTVFETPELDTITEMAVQGERRLHWALMVTMIFVYSLIGWLVATALQPLMATAGLLGLASLGFLLGERWIPDKGMHILGVTWVIISMKLLYGLAIDAHHWGWIDTPQLGGSLIGLIGVNILVGYRHKHDAIMAQATLVSLALASAAGSVGGELGVALMILLATMLLNGLALHRKSGNLASLGIAMSHLWIGLHAIQSEALEFGALKILPLTDPMPLFLLALSVTCVNGAMAARFSQEENWFSSGFSVLGLGKPRLWGVSVGLGMIGALLLLASGRDATGYSLGILTSLLAVYGGSYLVVRGVEPKEVLKPLISSLPFLLLILVGLEVDSGLESPLSGYEAFAALSAILTIAILLQHQSNVTDRVLWLGSLVLILLLTILIPAESTANGGDNGRLLLISLVLVHLASGALAIQRSSPSIAGAAVLAPWLWMFVHALWISSLESFSAARDIDVDLLIVIDPMYVAIYLTIAAIIQYPINLRLGDTGVNLAGRLLGATELSSRLRDSGLMRLWNLGLISGLGVWLMFIDARDEIGWYTVIGVASLAIVHIVAESQGRHQGNPRFILLALTVTFAIFQWNFSTDAIWMILITASSMAILLTRDEEGPTSQLLSLTMGLLTLQIVLFALERTPPVPLFENPPLDRLQTGFVMLFCSSALLSVYLPRARTLEKLLPPAISVVCLLSVQMWAAYGEQMHPTQSIIAIALFVGSAIYLAATGELRMELKQAGKRDTRIAEVQRRYELAAALERGNIGTPPPIKSNLLSSPDSIESTAISVIESEGESTTNLQQDGQLYHFADEELAAKAMEDTTGALAKSISQAITRGGMKMADPELYDLLEKQKKRRRRSGIQHDSEALDLLVGDIHHRPVIVLAFIAVTTLVACTFSWLNGNLNPGLMLLVSIFALALTWVSRERAKVHQLQLPDINGIEMPFFVTMGSLTLLYLVGHFGPFGSQYKQLDLLVLTFGLVGLAVISLFGRRDLLLRIPSAIEAVVMMLVISRIVGAMLVNAVPFPFTVNPLDTQHDLVDWKLPWLFLETVLMFLVLGWDWIEGLRRTNGMQDHRGAAGRGTFALMVVMISSGPAGLIAGILCLRRSFEWKQPAAVAITIYAILGGLLALLSWTTDQKFFTAYEWSIFGIGCIMVLAHVYTVFAKLPKWTTAWLWNAHILFPLGIFIVAGWSSWLVVGVLVLSLVTWVGGILQLRRGMRIMGAMDLVISICLALLIIQGGLLDPSMLLVMLIALGLELSIVAWLGTRHDLQLAQD